MSPTFLLLQTGIALAWLALALIVVYVLGLLAPGWREFCNNSLMAGVVGAILLDTVYLFVVLFSGASIIGMDLQGWLGICGAGFTLGALAYAVLRKRNKSAVGKSES